MINKRYQRCYYLKIKFLKIVNSNSKIDEKRYYVKYSDALSCPLCNHMDYGPPRSSVHGNSSAVGILYGLSFPPPEALPDSGIGPASLMSPGVAGGSLN